MLAALGQLNPARAVAPSGLGSGAVSIGYRKARTGKPAVLYELLNTSLGGTSTHDGTPIVMAMCHFTPGAPVEIIESEYPLRVRAFELVRDSAGAGRFRGGVGYAREFEMLEDSVLTVRSANHRFTAWGQSGGAQPARLARHPQSRPRRPRGAGPHRDAGAQGRRRHPLRAQRRRRLWPARGARAEAVRDDVRDGYVSAEAAAAVYKKPQG